MKKTNIIGTGIDLVENERMDEMLGKWGCKFKDNILVGLRPLDKLFRTEKCCFEK